VYFASAAPPVRYPNVYGIDMPSVDELIGHNRSDQEIAEAIGADWLIYQDLADLVKSAQQGNPSIREFDTSVFDGNYLAGDVTKDYLNEIAHQRNDAAQEDRRRLENGVIEMYNSN
jgi:amidophosphoribosyltransferase